MKKSKTKKLGIVQTRGLGDIIIALPIAKHYCDQGYEIYWPILEEFMGSFTDTVPWINWIPITQDHGAFFYDVPAQRLKNLGVTELLPLYQALTGHPEFAKQPWFQITGFDQYKYHTAGVPFKQKWTLNSCITRNIPKELALKESLVKDPTQPYMLYHIQGSDRKANIDLSYIPKDWQCIEITPDLTDSVFDWLSTIESAEAVVCIDSVFSNMIDQLNLTETIDCYFIPRSHIHLTPVLGGTWTILDPEPEVLKRIEIFKSG